MTDENWNDEHDRSLADLLGFDLTEERDDDVPDAVGNRLQGLFRDAIGDEPGAGVSPPAVVAAARRDYDPAARVARRDQERAEFARRRRRSTVIKGVLIAAAAALVVVAVPTLFRGGSSDSASNSAGVTTAAAAGVESDTGADSAGGGQVQAASSEAASSAAATAAATSAAAGPGPPGTSAASSAATSRVPPAASVPGPKSASVVPQTADALTSEESGGGSESDRTQSATAGSAAAVSESDRATSGTSCVWPRLGADAIAAALQALDLPSSTSVQQPVRAVCATGQLGAVTIPSAGVTVLVAADNGLTSDPRYDYSTARATATGDGISVLVLSGPPEDADRYQLAAADRAAVARAVLAAVR